MASSWESVIHFVAEDGNEYWAPLALKDVPEVGKTVIGYQSIDAIEAGEKSSIEVAVKKLLAPVPAITPIICVGLNYRNHANEASLPIPKDPPMWYKPATALASHDTSIPFPPQAQKAFPDFEGELTIVLRNSMRSLPPSEAIKNILGYTIGNDLTARFYQRSSGGQYTYAKGFDKFGPLGPRLVHPSVFNPSESKISTKVNGRTVQDSPFDFIFPVDELLSFLSQGTTIPAGTAIMTGTPSGVGWFQDPKCSLKDGDVVEVEVAPIGVLRNTIVFEKEE